MADIDIKVDPVTGMPILQKDWLEVYRNPSVWNEATGREEEGQQRIKLKDEVLAALKEAGFGDMVSGNSTFDPQFWSSTGDPYSYEDPILGSILRKTGEREGTRFQYEVLPDGTMRPTGETSIEEMYTNPGEMNKKVGIAFGSLLGAGLAGNALLAQQAAGAAGGAGALAGAAEPVASLSLFPGAEAAASAAPAFDAFESLAEVGHGFQPAMDAASAAGAASNVANVTEPVSSLDLFSNVANATEPVSSLDLFSNAAPEAFDFAEEAAGAASKVANATEPVSSLDLFPKAADPSKLTSIGKTVWEALNTPLGMTVASGALKMLAGWWADERAQKQYEEMIARINRNQNVSGIGLQKPRGLMSTMVSVPKFDAYKTGRG